MGILLFYSGGTATSNIHSTATSFILRTSTNQLLFVREG